MSRKPAAKNGRTGWRFCAVLLCAVLAVPLVPFESFAQEQRRTLFEMLFGRPVGRDGGSGREYQPRNRRDFPSAPRERSVTRPQPARKAPSVVPMRTAKPEPAAKLENARRVLVIGDFLAGGMGEELVNAFASSPAIAVDVRANGSSGLVRTDYYDWFTNLPQFISETKPATIVIMMGSNDRQQMQIGDIREKFGTEVWFKEYERRIDELLALAGRPKVPLLWVGLPAFQSPWPAMEQLDAERALLGAQMAALAGRQARLDASVGLIQATGGGWQNSEPEAVVRSARAQE